MTSLGPPNTTPLIIKTKKVSTTVKYHLAHTAIFKYFRALVNQRILFNKPATMFQDLDIIRLRYKVVRIVMFKVHLARKDSKKILLLQGSNLFINPSKSMKKTL